MLANILQQYDLKDDEQMISQLIEYKSLILEYNKIMDITNITDDEGIFVKHFLDSILVNMSELSFEDSSLIDIGTGGGFPGIPLKLYYPNLKLTLLDSLNKRITFLEQVISELHLTDTIAIHGRAEEYALNDEYREVFDFATSRAVAELRTLVEYCLAFVKVGGYFIAMKGPNFEEELANASNSINTMGGKLIDVINYTLPYDYGERSLIIIKKVKQTPKKYPRGQGKPRSKPL